MAKIYDTTDFPLQSVHLGTPINKGGVHFIKMTVSNSPIYIQPSKCIIKQGFIKSGKKIFCDLLFSIEDNSFLTWLEEIEELSKTQIFENRSKWFETELDKHDIENSMTSPYKMYKSGKMYIIRANVPNTLGKSELKIYDENEREIFHEDLKEDTNVITILELKGIKCSVRSFQFDIDIRQMLVVSPVQIFEKCIIRSSKLADTSYDPLHVPNQEKAHELKTSIETPLLDTPPESVEDKTRGVLEDAFNDTLEKHSEMAYMNEQPRELNLYTDELDNGGICEVELNLEKMENVETVQLKKRNDVYYKMYKEAKQKAKEAKMVALANYLEAKRIKNTYSLSDSSDSESESESDDNLEEAFSQKIPTY